MPPQSTTWQQPTEIFAHQQRAHTEQKHEYFDEALTAYRLAIELGDTLIDRDRGNAEWQEFLAALYSGAGGVHRGKRDTASALNMYRSAYGLRQTLATRDKSNKYRQRRLAVAGMSLAGLLKEQSPGSDEALKLYGEAIDILDELQPQYDRDVFSCYIGIGEILNSRNDWQGALQKYSMASGIAQGRAPKNASSTIWQKNLTSSYFKIGELLTAQDPSRALQHYQEALAFVSTELVAKYPDNREWQALASSLRAKLQNLMLKP
jgi:tetratricopeptide (TPR) repeat protein